MKWIAGIFFVVYILIATHTIGKIIALLVTRWLKVQKKYEKTPKLLNGIITTIIYLIALLMILSHFNVEISPLVAALGLGGLAIGLALQPTLTSLFAGIHIISDKPLQVGDYIELENQKIKGHVEDIGWRSTRLRSVGNNNIITIPNSMLAESIIINDSMPKKDMSLIVQCGVSYESDLEKVEKVSKDVAKKVIKKVEGTIKDYNPLVRFHTFGDSNIDFSIILRIKEYENQYLVRHEFIKALKARFDKEKIEISYPVRKMVK